MPYLTGEAKEEEWLHTTRRPQRNPKPSEDKAQGVDLALLFCADARDVEGCWPL